jgi:hypothetical protein
VKPSRCPFAVLLLAAIALPPLASAQQAPQLMSVTVKEVPVRDRASFAGKVVGTLAYADRVTVEETKGDWVKVSFAPKKIASAWMPKSALQTQAIALKAGDKAVGTSASSGEVALAGKGFNEEVESEYRKDKKLNYGAVDDMEAYSVAPDSVAQFAKDGGLSVEGVTP